MQYAGQSIAIILANTQAQADAAALLVTATYTNVLPPILTIADALANPERGVANFPFKALHKSEPAASPVGLTKTIQASLVFSVSLS